MNTAQLRFPDGISFDEAMALLRSSVRVTVQPLSDAQIERILARDAAAEAANETDE